MHDKIQINSLKSLIENNPVFYKLKNELNSSIKLSLTGITNLVVNYEDPDLVDLFLNFCIESNELYRESYDIDSVLLQEDAPGQGNSANYLDQLIYGSFIIDEKGNYVKDSNTGIRKRNNDGFVNRKIVQECGKYNDKILIIKNIDFCKDFCPREPGLITSFLSVFDNFRNASTRKKCRLLLVSNIEIKFPFKIRSIEFEKVDNISANYIIDSFTEFYKNNKIKIEVNENQRNQVIRKLNGLTYTESSDIVAYSMTKAINITEKTIDPKIFIKSLRDKVNYNLINDGFGLTHLNSKPWDDYICPSDSNFTYDVKKIMRDLTEIKNLIQLRDSDIQNYENINRTIESIQIRIPHIIVLYGKGGTGKSSYPIHLAGLLEFDVWDFNIGSTHSKWVGEGAERMRETLKKITKASHLIVRIDEYDRGMGSTGEAGDGMHTAHKQVEAEFMNWLQNCQEDSIFVKQNIFVVLTTNHKENITGPLLRSGRADLVIDIDNFDSKSVKEAFESVGRRSKNRGISFVGFSDNEELQNYINKLDLDEISEIARARGFTVRDVDVFIGEMAAHYYYFKKNMDGFDWTTDNFITILSNSRGSMRENGTGELILGDRFVKEKQENVTKEENKTDFFEEIK